MKKSIIYLDCEIDEETGAAAAGIAVFDNWEDEEAKLTACKCLKSKFLKGETHIVSKEVECYDSVLSVYKEKISAIVFNGYIMEKSGKDNLAGAGWRLACQYDVPIIGISSKPIRGSFALNRRGLPGNVLYITSFKYSQNEAAMLVEKMYGDLRWPKICKLLKRACKTWLTTGEPSQLEMAPVSNTGE